MKEENSNPLQYDPTIKEVLDIQFNKTWSYHEGRMIQFIDNLLPVECRLQLMNCLDKNLHVPGLLSFLRLETTMNKS